MGRVKVHQGWREILNNIDVTLVGKTCEPLGMESIFEGGEGDMPWGMENIFRGNEGDMR
jgi:hypothetical protein